MKKFVLPTSTLISAVSTLLCLMVVALPHTALADNAAGDFSLASNPNGNWTYGWLDNLVSAFHLDTNTTTSAYGQNGVDGWLSGLSSEGIPSVLYNTNSTQRFVAPTEAIQPGQLVLNPNNSNYAIVRWTASSTGLFSISATFSGVSTAVNGDSVDVHVLKNGTSIFDSTVNGTPHPTTYSGNLSLVAGDHIDFAVGAEGNGDNEDVTALSATVVPEPTTAVLTTTGLLGLLCVRKRKANINR